MIFFNLTKQRGAFVSEPAILVKRLTGSQIWSMEKLENKLIDMREMYQEYKDPMAPVSKFILKVKKSLRNSLSLFPQN